VYEYPLQAGLDFIIMVCDGIWEKKTNEEMVAWVYEQFKGNKNTANLQQIITDLLQKECLSPDYTQTGGIGCDNMTAMIIVFK